MRPESASLFSWSGGKDSALALWTHLQDGGTVSSLFTILGEGGRRTKSHALPRAFIQKQAESIGIPVLFAYCGTGGYEEALGEVFEVAAERYGTVREALFGDIDLEAHRNWYEKICGKRGVAARFPLWNRKREEVAAGFIDAGFSARIVAVDGERCPPRYKGEVFDRRTVEELIADGVDPAAEGGEFHTAVTGGPLFRFSVQTESRPPA